MSSVFQRSVFADILRSTKLQKNLQSRPFTASAPRLKAADGSFGLVFDIDGVIVRGKRILPTSKKAFSKLVDSSGRFHIPTVFLTNAGNQLRKQKADQLSDFLDVPIHEDQVIMAHSPLSVFKRFHESRVLVSGQGPVEDIARELGFKNFYTIEQIVEAFPSLDACDKKRKKPNLSMELDRSFPRIDAVVMFGEPVRWETSLQLIVDLLLTNGNPAEYNGQTPRTHIPVLACNLDLQWMAEAPIPRYGHGAFLLCLETLYEKITGRPMSYSGILGKPSEISYRYADHVIQTEAGKLGFSSPVKNLYCVGDNVCTDIFGANLYHKYLRSPVKQRLPQYRCMDHVLGMSDNTNSSLRSGAENCYSILVETGVYSPDETPLPDGVSHSPRDFLPVPEGFEKPSFQVKDVLEAVELAIEKESS